MLLRIKLKIWEKYCHPSDKRITCCNNCGVVLKYPKLLELVLGITNNNYPKNYNIVCDGIFKQTNNKDIIIVCNKCNNINLNINKCPEYLMIS